MADNNIQITDYSNERSGFRVVAPELTAGNIVAQTAAATALTDAVADLTLGHISRNTIANVLIDDPDLPTSPFAQRELKWLVRYRGVSSGKMYSLEIPAPDVTDNLVANTDIADPASADWAAFITAFNAYARTPDNVSANVEFVDARLVGRNL